MLDAMIELKTLQELSDRLAAALPPGLDRVRGELKDNFRSILQARLAELDLVTREQFDVQRALLLKSRKRLEELESRLASLEATSAATPSARPPATPDSRQA
ncbi:MAG: accessory factor UbiK family protein [Oceanococcaceae bacterium]